MLSELKESVSQVYWDWRHRVSPSTRRRAYASAVVILLVVYVGVRVLMAEAPVAPNRGKWLKGDTSEHRLRNKLGLILDRIESLERKLDNGLPPAAPTPPPPPPPTPKPLAPTPQVEMSCPVPLFEFEQCHDSSFAMNIQGEALERAHSGDSVNCEGGSGFCTCGRKGYVFNGFQCVKAPEWDQPFQYLGEKMCGSGLTDEVLLNKKIQHSLSPPDTVIKPLMIGQLDEKALFKYWQHLAANDPFTSYYAGIFAGKKILDIGSGYARQTLQFAENGAEVTFVDTCQYNLEVIQRVAGSLSVKAKYILMDDAIALDGLGKDYDVVTLFNSADYMPAEIFAQQAKGIIKHLKKGGRWLQVSRAITSWGGQGDFKAHANSVLGEGLAPWLDWWEVPKLQHAMRPHQLTPLWCGISKGTNYAWMDMLYRGDTKA